jgi:hypothetical protein
MPACNNLVVQIKFKLVCDMFYIHDGMFYSKGVSAFGEGD